jgi:hypothetical protein
MWSEMSKKKGKAPFLQSLDALDDTFGRPKRAHPERKGNPALPRRRIFGKPAQTTYKEGLAGSAIIELM